MYTGKKSSLLQWEKVLKVMLTGQSVSRESLEKMKEMEDVPMYRLSSFIYHVKLAGGVVKVAKNGRKIEAYELVNIKDMVKYLENREKDFTKKTKVTKLKDLAAKPAKPDPKKAPAKTPAKPAKPKKVSADVATADVVVEEVTEVTA